MLSSLSRDFARYTNYTPNDTPNPRSAFHSRICSLFGSNGKQTRESTTSSLNPSVRNHKIRTKQKRAPQKDARLRN
ncbi:hypothetical protein HMPREF1572_00976 [Gardnerella vaginalis JCP7275]|nr:hypothetical protein HMPREF1572_00976 [Gardnerella vaginalis JCP7275]